MVNLTSMVVKANDKVVGKHENLIDIVISIESILSMIHNADLLECTKEFIS